MNRREPVLEDRERLFISMVRRPKALSVATAPYPGFLRIFSPFAAFLVRSKGEELDYRTVFEDRLWNAADLVKNGGRCYLSGKKRL